MSGTLFVVATPIGNLEDITARALRILREVALIAAEDTRRTNHLLSRYAITTRTTSLHEHNEHSKAPGIIERLKAGEAVALVSDAGTPTVSDPGHLLIRQAIDAGIRVEPIPGPNAAIAALSVSGLPTTTFSFMGFPPTRSKDRRTWFEQVRTAGRTVVFYEAPHRLRATLEQLRSVAGDRDVAIGRELTKTHEELVRGPISRVIDRLADAPGEFTIVVDIGLIPEHEAPSAPLDPASVLAQFGEMIDNPAVTRRRAIAALSRRYGVSSGDIYDLLERAKKSTE
jgi:16S rRNA (cytidine1402-2'-O)-methyltransferase